MTAQCVLFDLDNTLTDRRQSITNFTRRFMAHFEGVLGEVSLEQLEETMQQGDNLGYKPKSQMFHELVNALPWHKPPSVEAIQDFWYAESPSCMQPRPDMFKTLTALWDSGYRLGMITNGRTAVQNATIDTIGVREYMEIIVISEAAGIRKPEAGIFQLALNQLGENPELTWYVGDHPWPEDQPLPTYQIDELSELLNLLAD